MARNTEIVAQYELKIVLLNTDPEVWRTIRVPRDIILENLHYVIQRAMGWEDEHLHEFSIGKKRYSQPSPNMLGLSKPPVNESIVRLNGVAKPNATFRYQYDFGDCWVHEIKIEREVLSESSQRLAICTGGGNACPPEGCGGAYGYRSMLSILSDPQHEEYGERKDWLGDEFDPLRFDLAKANALLGSISP